MSSKEGAVARAAAVIAPLSAAIEEGRRLPREAVDALVEARVFRLAVPRAYGGDQADVATLIDAIETIARADGSAGWCAMIGATTGLMSVFVDEKTAIEIYGPDDAITCGVTAPLGVATKTAEGFRVRGRWPFASGCEHSGWRMGTALLDGVPRCMIFRAEQTRVIDTWQTSGLRGTGSHDFEVDDVLVPERFSFSLFDERRRFGGVCAMPFFGLLATSVAAVAVGIARGALDAFLDVAVAKQPLGARRTIAHRELLQLDVARAEAKVRGAHALLCDAAGEAEREADRGDAPSLRIRAVLRAAAVQATADAASAVDLVYDAAGATSVYAKSPLQRHFRDVHVATQHVMVAPSAAVLAGRILLGVETDATLL
ncbi:MAG TPA: acyl-CoA dehydrogenase family protein [Polyangiaceae bacterium]|jgi:alkylation response protein AidB-like acyl-CoA dehydrogenase